MGKRIDGALVNCLATIEFIEELQAEMMNISQYLMAGNLIGGQNKVNFDNACQTIGDLLRTRKCEAFESYFMFATASKEPERKKAIELAYRRFFKANSFIAHYYNTHLIPPARWSNQIDDELRQEIENEINKEV